MTTGEGGGYWRSRLVFLMCRTLVVVAVVLGGCVESDRPVQNASASAREVEGRLFAPCCWIQTLDVHDSAIASELRAEIMQRLEAGESSGAIEDDLAARYGERIRAVPKGRDPRGILPSLVAFGMLVALITLSLVFRRWMRKGNEARASRSVDPSNRGADEFDDRIDRELARMADP